MKLTRPYDGCALVYRTMAGMPLSMPNRGPGYMTSEFPDSYNDSTGLSTTGRAKLVDTMFDHWQDLAEAMRIPWMGDQLLAIASIAAECLQRLDSVECAMPDITGEESAGADDVAAEVQHSDSDV